MRVGDAHPTGSKITEAIKLAGIDQRNSFLRQGEQLIHNFGRSIWSIGKFLSGQSRDWIPEADVSTWIPTDATIGGRIPHIPQLKEHNIRSGFFEHEDFLALRGALPDYAQVAASLAYYSGMRMGEVCSLHWRQINWTEGKLFLQAQDTKTKTPRVLYLTGDLYRVLLPGKPVVRTNGRPVHGSVIEADSATVLKTLLA